ncbi:septum formation family protein [Dactylosporangium sp. NPDC051541]|uniref:septum formation family protein n=1 Tax=Dactylosporangium sp. NPDC051541 TaxID=3363977 RepID=UPI00378BCFAE
MLIAAMVLLSLAGCDGAASPAVEATPSASPSPSAAAARPGVGMCHTGQSMSVYDYKAVTLNAVDCAESHQAEIIRVGQLTSPPENKTPEVYADCDTTAREYVGGDWHEGRLGLAIVVPSTDEWLKGAREYRCALFEFAADGFTSKARTGTLKDGLRGPRPLALSCMDVLGVPDAQGWYQEITRLVPIDCGQPHNGEFVGLYTGTATTIPDMNKLIREVTQSCNGKAAAFLGQSESKFAARTDVRVYPTGGNQEWWALGDRTTRCYILTAPDHRMTKSLKA